MSSDQPTFIDEKSDEKIWFKTSQENINKLTEMIKETYGSAYYANIHQKLQDLKNEGILNLQLIGRSINIQLNFQNYLLIDTLAEMEIEKKGNF
jgi:hypothetical protein